MNSKRVYLEEAAVAKKAKRESKPKSSGQKKIDASLPYSAPQPAAMASSVHESDQNDVLLFGDDHYDALAPGLMQ